MRIPVSFEKFVALLYLALYACIFAWMVKMGSGANELMQNNVAIVDAHNAGITPQLTPGHAFDAIWGMLGMMAVLILSPMAVRMVSIVFDPNA